MKANSWPSVREYINGKEIGYIFSRKDLLLFASLQGIKSTTMDTERNALVHGKFFKWVSRGRYELVNKIPTEATLAEVIALAFGTNLDYLEKVSARKEREQKI
jgi:hypothetical protein